MWAVSGNEIKMTEEDFGVLLPITINGTTFTANDEIKFAIKNQMNGETIIEQTFSNITDNTINLLLSATDSAKLKVGTYVYCLDWYQNGVFLCNIIPSALFRVGDKA